MQSDLRLLAGSGPLAVDQGWVQRSQQLVEREPWLISFLDLLMVMVTLLVLLVSYESEQVKTDVGPAIATPLMPETDRVRLSSDVPSPVSVADSDQGGHVPYAAVFDSVSDERAFLDQLYIGDLQGHVDVTVAGRQVKLGISDNILFTAGEAALSLSGQQLLDELAQMLHQRDWLITVEGHTDNRPIATPRYPSNWELSAARASQVTRYLIGKGLHDGRLRAVGYADTRPRAANDQAEGRARNRRVELVLTVPDKPVK